MDLRDSYLKGRVTNRYRNSEKIAAAPNSCTTPHGERPISPSDRSATNNEARMTLKKRNADDFS
jgi:hypothetical protein